MLFSIVWIWLHIVHNTKWSRLSKQVTRECQGRFCFTVLFSYCHSTLLLPTFRQRRHDVKCIINSYWRHPNHFQTSFSARTLEWRVSFYRSCKICCIFQQASTYFHCERPFPTSKVAGKRPLIFNATRSGLSEVPINGIPILSYYDKMI